MKQLLESIFYTLRGVKGRVKRLDDAAIGAAVGSAGVSSQRAVDRLCAIIERKTLLINLTVLIRDTAKGLSGRQLEFLKSYIPYGMERVLTKMSRRTAWRLKKSTFEAVAGALLQAGYDEQRLVSEFGTVLVKARRKKKQPAE